MARSVDSLNLVLSSPNRMTAFGYAIGRALRGGDVLALIGELGAGKTVLVKGIGTGLGIPSATVTSPTFVLIHQYQGRLPLVHIDLYRLQRSDEADSIGLSDCFRDEVATAVEWADRFFDLLPHDRLEVRLVHRTRHAREVQIRSCGPRSRALMVRIRQTADFPWIGPRSLRSSFPGVRKATRT